MMSLMSDVLLQRVALLVVVVGASYSLGWLQKRGAR